MGKLSPAEQAKACKRYCDAMAKKVGVKQAMVEAGWNNHQKLDLAWYVDTRNPKHVVPDPKFATMGDEAKNAYVALARVKDGLSWGYIAAKCMVSETEVRNRFGLFTGLSSEGMRQGHGGRFLQKEHRFYTGNRKGFGVEDAKPRALDPAKVEASAGEAASVLPAKVQAKVGGARKRVQRKAGAAKG